MPTELLQRLGTPRIGVQILFILSVQPTNRRPDKGRFVPLRHWLRPAVAQSLQWETACIPTLQRKTISDFAGESAMGKRGQNNGARVRSNGRRNLSATASSATPRLSVSRRTSKRGDRASAIGVQASNMHTVRPAKGAPIVKGKAPRVEVSRPKEKGAWPASMRSPFHTAADKGRKSASR